MELPMLLFFLCVNFHGHLGMCAWLVSLLILVAIYPSLYLFLSIPALLRARAKVAIDFKKSQRTEETHWSEAVANVLMEIHANSKLVAQSLQINTNIPLSIPPFSTYNHTDSLSVERNPGYFHYSKAASSSYQWCRKLSSGHFPHINPMYMYIPAV